MYTFHKRHPWIVSYASALVFLAVALVGRPIGDQIEHWARLPVNSGILIQQLLLVLVSALAVILFGGWREAGFDKPFQFKTFLYTFPPLVGPIFLLLYSGV